MWKNAFELGKAAARIAIVLAGGAAVDEVEIDVSDMGDSAPASGNGEAATFTTPGGDEVSSIILTPIPITQDNLNVPIDAGWITQDVVCKGVPAGSVPACA